MIPSFENGKCLLLKLMPCPYDKRCLIQSAKLSDLKVDWILIWRSWREWYQHRYQINQKMGMMQCTLILSDIRVYHRETRLSGHFECITVHAQNAKESKKTSISFNLKAMKYANSFSYVRHRYALLTPNYSCNFSKVLATFMTILIHDHKFTVQCWRSLEMFEDILYPNAIAKFDKNEASAGSTTKNDTLIHQR